MKSNLNIRMFIILIINVIAVAASVYAIIYITTSNALTEDIRRRAEGVKDYILDNLGAEDFIDIGEQTDSGINAAKNIQRILEQLQGVGNLERLYIAKERGGGFVTTLNAANPQGAVYEPQGELRVDLKQSIDERAAVFGSGIYQTPDGAGVYSIFWPVFNESDLLLGVVCMEFDVDVIYKSQRAAARYSIVLSVSLIVLFAVLAYLSMSRVSEPFYKKLAYTDILTGYENRMAFEHNLRQCGDIADSGGRVTLVIFDINNLKTVNDVQGHKAGDLYLKATADILYEYTSRLNAPLYRIGGDEFASLITNRSEREEQALLETLKTENRPTLKNQPFSCAFGAATFTKGVDTTLRDVFKRADEAMYVEKKRQKSLT